MSTQDYVFRQGTTPQTRALLSLKNRVYSFKPNAGSAFIQIGVMSSFAPTHTRDVQEVRGIGYGDVIAELVPNVQPANTIAVSRTALYLESVFQVFGYKHGIDGLARALRHHRWPFDIKQEVVFSDITDEEARNVVQSKDPCHVALITIYEACWMTNYTATYASDTSLVTEDVDISCTDVLDGRSRYQECIDTGNAFASGRFTGVFSGSSISRVQLNPVGGLT